MNSRKAYNIVGHLMLISILSKILGFVREFIIAYKLGASAVTDAYFVSITLAITFCGGILSAFSTSFIPVYSTIVVKKPENKKDYINSLQTLLFLMQIIIITLFFVLRGPVIDLFFGDMSIETKKIIVTLTNVMIFATIVSAIRSVVGGYLQYNNHIPIVYFSMNVLQNAIIILSVLIVTENTIVVLGYGYIFAAVVVSSVLYYAAKRAGFSYNVSFNFFTEEIKETVILTLPIFVNLILMDINTFVDRTIASGLGEGVISALSYAYKINDIFVVTFATTIATALYPQISKFISGGNNKKASILISKSMVYLSILLIPFSVMLTIYSKEIVSLMLQRGAFNADNAKITAQCLRYYSIGMLFFAFRQVLYRAMLSNKMTKQVMMNSVVVVSINILLNIILSKIWGHIGIALATSISTIITTLLMLISLKKKEVRIDFNKILKPIAFVFLIAVITMCGSYLFYQVTIRSLTVNSYIGHALLIGVIGLALLFYVLIMYIARIEEVYEFINMCREKIIRHS